MTERPIAEPDFAELSRLRLHYLDWPGADPPVVLLHPTRGNAHVWDFTVIQSRRPDRVIAVDQRGHGGSEWPSQGYQLDDYAQDSVELIEHLRAGPVTLVGAGAGGSVALLVASERPDLVRALALVDPCLSVDPALSAAMQAEAAVEREFSSLEEAAASLPFSSLWTPAERLHYARCSFQQAESGAWVPRYHARGVRETEAALEADLWSRIRVRCPTLVVRGVRSPVFDRRRMLRLANEVPDCVLVEVPRAAHRVSQDNPAALAAALDQFLDALDRDRGVPAGPAASSAPAARERF